MTQSASCPNCGSPVSEQQQFCGICGAKLTGFTQPQPNICPGCGSSITPEQQFCGVCGANLSAGGMQQPIEVQSQPEPSASPKITPVVVTDTPSAPESTPATESTSPAPGEAAVPGPDTQRTIRDMQQNKGPIPSRTMGPITPARSYLLIRIAAVIFDIFGWIILVGGCIGSIGMAVFAGIGGKFVTAVPGFTSLEGIIAIGIAIGCLIASLIYGFGLLAFAEVFRAIIDIARNTRQ